jgi:hypothetical protein
VRRTGIKASRPLDVDTSLLSSLGDRLRDYCVLVTKLSFSLPSSALPSHAQLHSHSTSISHSRVLRCELPILSYTSGLCRGLWGTCCYTRPTDNGTPMIRLVGINYKSLEWPNGLARASRQSVRVAVRIPMNTRVANLGVILLPSLRCNSPENKT